MEASAWLFRVRELDRKIDAKLFERDHLRAMITKVTANIGGVPHGKAVVDRIGDGTMRLLEVEAELNTLIDSYIDHKQEVVAALEELPPDEYDVLHRRYIRYMTWGQIAKDLHYSKRQVYRIHKKGLKMTHNVTQCHSMTRHECAIM